MAARPALGLAEHPRYLPHNHLRAYQAAPPKARLPSRLKADGSCSPGVGAERPVSYSSDGFTLGV